MSDREDTEKAVLAAIAGMPPHARAIAFATLRFGSVDPHYTILALEATHRRIYGSPDHDQEQVP